jgi:pimeloyl-ACP methyl ester carboxylesterase
MMKATIDSLPPTGANAKSVRVLVVGPDQPTSETPVLLFLHGRGEASPYENELPLVMTHLSPPFQALCGHLSGVTVVAPQAPYNMKVAEETGWNWRDHVDALAHYLEERYKGRKVLATGFSRGGLGVLQLLRKSPELITKWAIVDPQRAHDDKETNDLMPDPNEMNGWLRYGPGIQANKPFGDLLAKRIRDSRFVDLDHGTLALCAYKGEIQSDTTTVYSFLDLKFAPPQ